MRRLSSALPVAVGAECDEVREGVGLAVAGRAEGTERHDVVNLKHAPNIGGSDSAVSAVRVPGTASALGPLPGASVIARMATSPSWMRRPSQILRRPSAPAFHRTETPTGSLRRGGERLATFFAGGGEGARSEVLDVGDIRHPGLFRTGVRAELPAPLFIAILNVVERASALGANLRLCVDRVRCVETSPRTILPRLTLIPAEHRFAVIACSGHLSDTTRSSRREFHTARRAAVLSRSTDFGATDRAGLHIEYPWVGSNRAGAGAVFPKSAPFRKKILSAMKACSLFTIKASKCQHASILTQ